MALAFPDWISVSIMFQFEAIVGELPLCRKMVITHLTFPVRCTTIECVDNRISYTMIGAAIPRPARNGR